MLYKLRPLAVVLLALLAVCGSAAARDNVLRIANASEIDSLDPHTVQDVARLAVKINSYDPLFRWIGNPPQLEPWLAERATASEDGRLYTVKLAKGAKFHDGSEITSDDVIYSLHRTLALKQGPARFFLPLIDVEKTRATDPHTVQFALKMPAAPFVGMLAELFVVNKKIVQAHEKDGDWAREWLSKNTAASGPFHVTEYDPAVGWYAERFVDHFKGWHANPVDGIRFRTIRELNSQVLALMRGDADMFVGTLSVDQVERMAKAPNLVVMKEPHQRLFLINFDNQRPPFNDMHVRRAFSYAFDYDGFIKGIINGNAQRNPAPVPKTMWGYPEGAEGFTYDIDKAKAELAQAAVKIDRPLNIHVMTGIPRTEQAAQVLMAGLRKLGVEARIVSETWPTLSGKCRSPDSAPDIMPIWASANYADPQSFVGEMYDSTAGNSYATCSYYKNAEVDGLLAKAYSSQEQKVRAQLYADASRIVMKEAPSIFIYNEDWLSVRNKRVSGYQFSPIGNGNFLKPISLDP